MKCTANNMILENGQPYETGLVPENGAFTLGGPTSSGMIPFSVGKSEQLD